MLFDPAEANHFSPMRIDLYCFPSKLERQPSKCQNFEAQSHSLFSRCLRLATTITGSHPRLATGGWLDLTRQAFHLLDYSPLSGRTIPICLFHKFLLFVFKLTGANSILCCLLRLKGVFVVAIQKIPPLYLNCPYRINPNPTTTPIRTI